MNNIQRRSKNACQIPPIHTVEPKTQTTTIVDPRSPSANITRTPVDLQTYQLPTGPKMNTK